MKKLDYYEIYNSIYQAIKREKAMKKWLRKWKIELIEKSNPEWKDLYNDIIEKWIPAFTGMTLSNVIPV